MRGLARDQSVDPLWRFWFKVVPAESGCWEWTAKLDRAGYGVFVPSSRRQVPAHRYAYSSFVGEIPAGLYVCHACDNPRCVNPNHLWLGTHRDNMNDKIAKGRHANIVADRNRAKTHCPKGHEFVESNVYRSQGKRTCRACNIEWHRQRRDGA